MRERAYFLIGRLITYVLVMLFGTLGRSRNETPSLPRWRWQDLALDDPRGVR